MAGVARSAWLPLLCIGVLTANGATPSLSTDSIGCTDSGVTLEEVTVEAQSRRPARVSSDGSVTLDATVTGQRMRAFGEADAMRWIGTLPGISSAGDYASGVSVDGTEYSHTYYGIGGAPVFFLIISEAYSRYSMPSIIRWSEWRNQCIHRICLLALADASNSLHDAVYLKGFAGWSM